MGCGGAVAVYSSAEPVEVRALGRNKKNDGRQDKRMERVKLVGEETDGIMPAPGDVRYIKCTHVCSKAIGVEWDREGR